MLKKNKTGNNLFQVNNENTCARNEAEKPDFLKTEVKTERQSGLEEEEDGGKIKSW